MADAHCPTASGQRAHSQVGKCKAFVAKTIVDGSVRALKRLRHQTDEEGPFQFWITSHMFDETKLWYIVRGKGYRNLSTLAYHSQVTWEDRLGIHDEDIIRPPKAMRRYSAAGQWAIGECMRCRSCGV